MNYELAICFLFILLFIIYFYFQKKPIIEGADIFSEVKKIIKGIEKIPKDIQKIPKEAKKDFDKAKKATEKGFDKAKKETQKGLKKAESEINKGTNFIKKELEKVKKSILDPINKWAKQVEKFFKNLGRLFEDWAKFISGNIMCGINNISSPFCLICNIISLFGLIIYGIIWLVILVFLGESMANSYGCAIGKIQEYLWKFSSPSLRSKINKCSKGCSSQIPIWDGKKLKSAADMAKDKCNIKPKIDVDEDNFLSVRIFYWMTLLIFLGYQMSLSFMDDTQTAIPILDDSPKK
jgi:F0F1-type ATP synthase membrane subunit b/b'